MRICSKKTCNNIGRVNHTNKQSYCFKCYRFQEMRHASQGKGKYKPNLKELERILPLDMICPMCDKKMIWHTSLGIRKDVVTLQHNHNGDVILICYSCNAGHANSYLGDEYFNLNNNEKYCPRCNEILSKNKFSKTKRNKDNLNNICKQCRSKIYYRNKKLGEK